MAAIFRFYQTCGEAPGQDYAQGFGLHRPEIAVFMR